MVEIDLIPENYRQRLRVRVWLRNFAIVYIATVIGLVVAKVLLSHGISNESVAIQKLKVDKAAVLAHKAKLDELRAEQSKLEDRLSVLTKLRRGPPVIDIFETIDSALDKRVWFLSWKFLRAGEFVEVKPQAVKTGYFIVLPDGEPRKERKAWRVQAHMEIKAQAINHSALAEFVERLSAQPAVKDIKVLNTRAHRRASVQAVDFELAVIVNSHYSKT